MKLDAVNHYVHAYRMAPWRIQRQWIGNFMLCVLGLAMVASLYLDVTAQAAISGREIQGLAQATISVQQGNADLQTKLAALTSAHDGTARRRPGLCARSDPTRWNTSWSPVIPSPKAEILAITAACHERAHPFPRIHPVPPRLAGCSSCRTLGERSMRQHTPGVPALWPASWALWHFHHPGRSCASRTARKRISSRRRPTNTPGCSQTYYPDRGEIYDRTGHLLAGNQTVYEIGVHLASVNRGCPRHCLGRQRRARTGLRTALRPADESAGQDPLPGAR